MNKLYIDGKLVDECSGTFQGKYFVVGAAPEITAPILKSKTDVDLTTIRHLTRECLTLPTYFCPHCARKAMRHVAPHLADPMTGMFAGPLKG